ncbi:hypothetical protein HMY34_07685 [Thiothrix subterranea]|uniref:hypothetical protein n=1 Tax=Thiothrix subterranea TaxID=2735563 RepID=UPI00192BDC47|nr:hypothetical protein [Thiothrix subterranea]QQZ28642.1 hypothetical protein HMY34_07685 [Thiothrix subterranea]
MKLLKPSLLASSALLLALTGTAFGEAGISSKVGAAPDSVTANVNFKIKVPEIIILRVGDWGNTKNTLIWDYAFGSGIAETSNTDATSAQWGKITADAVDPQNANSDNESASDKAGDGILKVAAFSNTGDVRLTSAIVTDFTAVTAGFNKPSLSEISATDGGSIAHTALNGFTGGTVDLTNTAGLVKLTDAWQYTYTPTNNPAAGEYNAEVKYTLANI